MYLIHEENSLLALILSLFLVHSDTVVSDAMA